MKMIKLRNKKYITNYEKYVKKIKSHGELLTENKQML